MANVSRESIGTLHEKITVTVNQQDYLPELDKKLKEYAKKANIPGFRKGMVPTGLVRKMYGQSILSDEVIKTASKVLEDYLKNAQLSIFAQPMILPGSQLQFDINNPTEYIFDFEIGIKPEFEVTPVKNKAHITRYKIEVTEKMLSDETIRIQNQHSTEETQQEATTNQHIVYAILEFCDKDGIVLDTVNISDFTSELGKLPLKLQEMLLGKKAEDSIVFRPIDVCTDDELNGFLKNIIKEESESAENHYLLTIKKIGILVPKELGIELYEIVYKDKGVLTEEDFKNKLKEELAQEFSRIATERLHNEIYEMLVHNTHFQLPAPFLKRYLREGGEKQKEEQEVETEYPSFEHSLRWQLISDRLVSEFGIKVSKDEVLNDIMLNVLSYFGVNNIEDAPWLESYKEKISKDEKTMNETFSRLMAYKLFKELETVFNVEEKEISEEDFFKIGDAHEAHHHHH